VKISEIKIAKRCRGDMGDLASLAASIGDVGLLHPVAIDSGNGLISGARRIAAFKLLGRESIPAVRVEGLDDAAARLRAERDENTCRKGFTPSEAVALGERLEALEKPKAKQRERRGKSADGKAGGRGKKKPGGKLPQGSEGRTREKVGAAVGMSGKTYEKAKEVVQAARSDPKTFGKIAKDMDADGKVDRAYRKVRQKRREDQPPPKLPPDKYAVLYADPPWRYEYAQSDSRKVENQYPTMETAAICALPIADLCAPDCVFFLWATSPKLLEALAVIEAWGFSYRTCAVWVKDKIGMGYYVRQQHELLLIAKRGNPPMPAPGNRPSSVVNAPRGQHSSKPDKVAALIETMYPKRPRIELFARKARPGWEAWGNEL